MKNIKSFEEFISESYKPTDYSPINEDISIWHITKGIIAMDAIKAGVSFAGGGIFAAGSLDFNLRKPILNKIEAIARDEKYKDLKIKATSIADKFNGDPELTSYINDLNKFPYTDPLFTKGKREKSKAESNNIERNRIMRELSKYVKSKLTDEEKTYFVEINDLLKDVPVSDSKSVKVEEDAMSDSNRMVGTGTYTPVSPADQNYGVNTGRSSDDAIGVDSIARF